MIRGAWLQRVEIDGYIDDVMINGVDVGPLIEAELDRRDPDRMLVRPTDADGFPARLGVVVRRWDTAVQRARALPEGPAARARRRRVVLHRDPATPRLRHRRLGVAAVLGDPAPYPALGLAHSEMPDDTPAVPHDADARPSVDEILAVRSERMATVERVLRELTDERLERMTQPVLEPVPRIRVVPGPSLPRRRGERGVAAPRVRRARPRQPRGTVDMTPPASSPLAGPTVEGGDIAG